MKTLQKAGFFGCYTSSGRQDVLFREQRLLSDVNITLNNLLKNIESERVCEKTMFLCILAPKQITNNL